jgi:hypothetical protein
MTYKIKGCLEPRAVSRQAMEIKVVNRKKIAVFIVKYTKNISL